MQNLGKTAADDPFDMLDRLISSQGAHSRLLPSVPVAVPVMQQSKPLNSNAVPAIPVFPAPKQGTVVDTAQTDEEHDTVSDDKGRASYLYSTLGNTGITGTPAETLGNTVPVASPIAFLNGNDGSLDQCTQSRSGDLLDANEERAAIVEYDAGTPRAWAEGFARLDPDRPPADVPARRWVQFIDDIGRFFDGGFAERAAALGWGAFDIFGCDRDRPFARIDQQGLCWLIAGDRLVDLSENTAIIATWTGARQTFRRKPSEPGRVLAWELVPCAISRLEE